MKAEAETVIAMLTVEMKDVTLTTGSVEVVEMVVVSVVVVDAPTPGES